MIHRVMNACTHARSSVATVNSAKMSQPRRKSVGLAVIRVGVEAPLAPGSISVRVAAQRLQTRWVTHRFAGPAGPALRTKKPRSSAGCRCRSARRGSLPKMWPPVRIHSGAFRSNPTRTVIHGAGFFHARQLRAAIALLCGVLRQTGMRAGLCSCAISMCALRAGTSLTRARVDSTLADVAARDLVQRHPCARRPDGRCGGRRAHVEASSEAGLPVQLIGRCSTTLAESIITLWAPGGGRIAHTRNARACECDVRYRGGAQRRMR
jgi:hypothetical protein